MGEEIEGKVKRRNRNGKGGQDQLLAFGLESEKLRMHFLRICFQLGRPNMEKLKMRM